ncbi:MAG TPA: hypothetical protein VLB68_24335 [Pyrinomonadaceae bacterium]|nr:hypothetical protein [Pyrinomonadaceae bacterium]
MASLNKIQDLWTRTQSKPGLKRWFGDMRLLVEVFVLINLAFLTLDIYLAHSTNDFHRRSEYIPRYYSAVAPLLLLIGLIARERFDYSAVWRDLGYLVGWLGVLIGLTGVILISTVASFTTIRSRVSLTRHRSQHHLLTLDLDCC